MLIKCPQCSVSYNVPDDKLGDAPRKMRCNRCKHVFAVVRRSEAPPAGYEEFTGATHALPPEFAFLREVPSIAPPAPAAPTVEEPRTTAPTPVAVASTETTYKGPPPPPPSQSSTSLAAASTQAAAPVVPPQERDDDTTMPVQRFQPRPVAYTWENQDPLELDSFAVGLENPRTKMIGMIISGVLVAAVLFFIFVAYRNGWSLSMDRLGKSVSYALSGRPTERLPAEVDGLEITVESTRTVKRSKAPDVLVVEGSVFNDTALDRSDVMLRLRIFDKSDRIAVEVEAPCGKFLKESEITLLAAGEATAVRSSSCSVRADSTAVYQFLLEEFPAEFDPSTDVEVKAISAAIR